MTSDALIFDYAPVLARVLTQNGRLKNKDAFFVCLNFYATVHCKKALSERQLQRMPRSAVRRFFETYHCVGKCCKRSEAPLLCNYQLSQVNSDQNQNQNSLITDETPKMSIPQGLAEEDQSLALTSFKGSEFSYAIVRQFNRGDE